MTARTVTAEPDSPPSEWDKSGRLHLFEKRGKRFVLDTGSGVATELDAVSWYLLKAINDGESPALAKESLSARFRRKDVELAFAELEELFNEGDLYAPDPYMEKERVPGGGVSALCLIVSEDCNLRCRYCFADAGAFSGSRRLMSGDTARRAVDYLMQNSPSSSVNISFFGGEPLINFTVVRQTVAYAREKAAAAEKEVGFSITTNGVALTAPVRRWLAKHDDVALLVSLDGGKDVHDKYRRDRGGKGSHHRVVRNLERLLEQPGFDPERLSVRGTFTPQDASLAERAEDILSLGIRRISLEPAVVEEPPGVITPDAVETFKKEYDRLADLYLARSEQGEPFSFFHFDQIISQVAFASPLERPCGAGAGYFAVGADGSLYPCHRFTGVSDFRMGSVDGGKENAAWYGRFARINVNEKEECRSCWAKYHCGGGCHKHGLDFSGSVYRPYGAECALLKYRVELGIYLYSMMRERSPEQAAQDHAIERLRRPEFTGAGGRCKTC